ncbi:MAG: flagellar assembly protein FliW [Lentisphaeraceae bacterium]|nr:flagellar assembly protein FliW [Lentisphaeraceae bacterium]
MRKPIDFNSATAMEIRHGGPSTVVPLEQEVVFKFDKGLPAFEECTDFVFVLDEGIRPFVCMQSLNNNDLSFICVDPFLINSNYTARLTDCITDQLDIKSHDDVLVLAVVTVNPDMEQTTANLMGPIVLNVKNTRAMQVILEDVEPELVRYNVMKGIEALEAAEAASESCAG